MSDSRLMEIDMQIQMGITYTSEVRAENKECDLGP